MKEKAKEYVGQKTDVKDGSNTMPSNLINITQQESNETCGEKVKYTM